MTNQRVKDALNILNLHYQAFHSVEPYASLTGHPVPSDTRGWSQVLVSVLTDLGGIGRKKGPDLSDGSDVKGANTWKAIDTPRFNGVIKAGTKASSSGNMTSLNDMPFLFLALWDETVRDTARCRIWVVRPKNDAVFRQMCRKWYEQRASGEINSNNFQLHPPRGLDSNVIRNTCSNLEYPLYFSAERHSNELYRMTTFGPKMLTSGACKRIS